MAIKTNKAPTNTLRKRSKKPELHIEILLNGELKTVYSIFTAIVSDFVTQKYDYLDAYLKIEKLFWLQ